MKRWISLAIVIAACGGVHRAPARGARPSAAARDLSAEREKRANAAVAVRGIEGSMSTFDVRVTMEKRAREFAACHEPRADALPVLAGQIEFAIAVAENGSVGKVEVLASDLGDRVLERCLSDVILETPFPRPNGGDANVSWTMLLEPTRPDRGPETWASDRIGRIVSKHGEALRSACGVSTGADPLFVTAYVSSRGQVVAAGVASRDASNSAHFDCIADGLREWPMPKPKRRFAKVSFALPGRDI